MVTSEPEFWGSWKGRVLKAIVIDGARRWDEIRDLTGLSAYSLNIALNELEMAGALAKTTDGAYWVDDETYFEYKEFFKEQESADELVATVPVKFSDEKQRNLADWIDQWKKVKGLDFSLENKHFFLEGRHLDDISNELISHARSEVLVANPYVSRCGLSNTLRDASRKGVRTILVTRPTDNENNRKYHTFMKEDGIGITYNKSVHAKLIAVDRAVAVVSSMNFYSASSGGASWEAGTISIENRFVESVADAILRLLEKPESMKLE